MGPCRICRPEQARGRRWMPAAICSPSVVGCTKWPPAVLRNAAGARPRRSTPFSHSQPVPVTPEPGTRPRSSSGPVQRLLRKIPPCGTRWPRRRRDLKRLHAAAATSLSPRRRWPRSARFALNSHRSAALAVVLFTAGIWWWRTSTPNAAAAARHASPCCRSKISVPPRNAYFADGVTDEVRNKLALPGRNSP